MVALYRMGRQAEALATYRTFDSCSTMSSAYQFSHAYRKLGVTNRTGASRWAHQNGLLGEAPASDDDVLDQTRG